MDTLLYGGHSFTQRWVDVLVLVKLKKGNSWRRPLRWNTRPMEHNHVVSMIRSLIKAHREAGEMSNRQRAAGLLAADLCQSLVFVSPLHWKSREALRSTYWFFAPGNICKWWKLAPLLMFGQERIDRPAGVLYWPLANKPETIHVWSCMVYFPKLIWFLWKMYVNVVIYIYILYMDAMGNVVLHEG